MFMKKIKKFMLLSVSALSILSITVPAFAEEETSEDYSFIAPPRPDDYDPDWFSKLPTQDESLTHCHLVYDDYNIKEGTDEYKALLELMEHTAYSPEFLLTYKNIKTGEKVVVNFGVATKEYLADTENFYTTFDGTYELTHVDISEFSDLITDDGMKYVRTTSITATPETENIDIMIDLIALYYDYRNSDVAIDWKRGYSENKKFFDAVFGSGNENLPTKANGEANTYDDYTGEIVTDGEEESTTIVEDETQPSIEDKEETNTETTKTKTTFKDWLLKNLIIIIILVVLVVAYLIYHTKNTKTK